MGDTKQRRFRGVGESLRLDAVRSVLESNDVEAIITTLNEEKELTIFLVEQHVVVAMDVSDRHYSIDQGESVDEM